MKKNKMFRLASVLLILVMLTTGIVGGTFAKYTTTGSASDTARVAKWGVVINTSGSLYSNAYAIATAGTGTADLPIAWVANPGPDAITVATALNTDGNIVAPGTESAGGLHFGISGKPEVAVTVTTTVKAEDIFLAPGTYGVLVPTTVSNDLSLKTAVKDHPEGVYGFKSNAYTKIEEASAAYDADTQYYILTDKVTVAAGAAYYPVKYKLTDAAAAHTDQKAVQVADILAKAVASGATDTDTAEYKAVYTSTSEKIAANTDLSTDGPIQNEDIAWAWAIGTAAENPKDTLLGNLIAARESDAPGYVVVSVADSGAVTALNISKTADDYTVKNSTNAVVANLRTRLDISLTVAQVD